MTPGRPQKTFVCYTRAEMRTFQLRPSSCHHRCRAPDEVIDPHEYDAEGAVFPVVGGKHTTVNVEFSAMALVLIVSPHFLSTPEAASLPVRRRLALTEVPATFTSSRAEV